MSMTFSIEISKSEVFARLAEHLIPLAQQAAEAGILIQDFERGLFGGLLAVGGKVVDAFRNAQGDGDRGIVFTHQDRTLHRSDAPVAQNDLWSASIQGVRLSRRCRLQECDCVETG